MLQDNTIEVSPLAYMRGRTFKDTFIIADEMQNSSPSQMQMLSTRIGKGSRLVITGDLNQSDRSGKNGLEDVIGKITVFHRNNPSIPKMVDLVSLGTEDVQRSKIVKHMIDVYDFRPPSPKISIRKPIDFDALYARRDDFIAS